MKQKDPYSGSLMLFAKNYPLIGSERAGKNIPELIRIPYECQLRGNGPGGFDPEITDPKNTVENVLVRGIIGDAREGNDDLALAKDPLSIHQPILVNIQRFRKVCDDPWVHQRPPAYGRFE